MTGVETIRALGDDASKLLKDIPIDYIVKGVQVLSRPLFIRYFKGYRIQVAGKRLKEMIDREVLDRENEELAQLFMTLWNRANGRLYHAMYNLVRTIDEEVDKIESIDDDKAREFIDGLLEDFDAPRIFMCTLLNEVRFSKEVIKEKLEREVPVDDWPPKPEPDPDDDSTQSVSDGPTDDDSTQSVSDGPSPSEDKPAETEAETEAESEAETEAEKE